MQSLCCIDSHVVLICGYFSYTYFELCFVFLDDFRFHAGVSLFDWTLQEHLLTIDPEKVPPVRLTVRQIDVTQNFNPKLALVEIT